MKYITLIFSIALLASCGIKGRMEAHDKAKADADYIVDNLTSYALIKTRLPEKYFEPVRTQEFTNNIEDNCDWKNRNGKFVDYFTMGNIGGTDQTAFIYEYFLDCDSLRVILIYNMEEKSPELFKIDLEQIEKKNQMIIDPSKQLMQP